MRTNARLVMTTSREDHAKNVLAYAHPELVERLKNKLGLSHDAAVELFGDVKKYLYLVGVNGKKLSPPKPIDAGWHEFLMYTRDYQNFCQGFFGRFIHHTPDPVLGPRLVVPVCDTIKLAETTFGALGKNWAIDGGGCESECAPDSDCHGDGSCGGDV